MLYVEWSRDDLHWQVLTKSRLIFRTCPTLQDACGVMADPANCARRWEFGWTCMANLHRAAMQEAVRQRRRNRKAK